MKVKKIKSGKDERQILTAMITDDVLLGRLAPIWKENENLFEAKWANLVGGWCVYFYNRYGKAPENRIERLYDKWAKKSKDKETVSLVEQLLGDLSSKYNTKKNHRFELDHAESYFNKVRLKRINKQIKNSIDEEDLEEAQKAHTAYSPISLSQEGPIIIGQDWDAVKRAFSRKNLEPVVEYNKGALKKFFGPYLAKNNFIAFIAPDKRGKSFWLLDVAYRAWIQGRRVAYFDTGDMTDEQVIRRIGSRCSGLPYRKQKYKFPERLWRNKADDTAKLEFDNRRSRKRLSFKEARNAIRIAQERSKRNGSFRLQCYPSGTCGVGAIAAALKQWERESGFVPEVIVIDYADLLMAPPGIADFRHQINKSWEQMRALSQQIDCLVVTATQANAASYKSELMGRWNFSEDKRKLAHVTGMVGINASVKEQDRGIQRLNWIVLREGEFSYSKCVHVANCLAISNPAVRSCW